MISQLRGKVVATGFKHIVLDVNGVGYKVFASSDTISSAKSSKNKEITLLTYLAVRENALDLYGFLNDESLDYFELLLTVSGIGPKSAISILSIADAKTLEKAISANDTSYLTKVAGIGGKTASKIVNELKDKIGAIDGVAGYGQDELDAIEALKALGYSQNQSRDALKEIDSKITKTGDRVKAALKILGR